MLIFAINNIRKEKLGMKKELAYFNIEGEYGGNQNWFYDPMMRLGGCAAIATCDLCIYLNLYRGKLSCSTANNFGRVPWPCLRP